MRLKKKKVLSRWICSESLEFRVRILENERDEKDINQRKDIIYRWQIENTTP